jgi:PhnB protein
MAIKQMSPYLNFNGTAEQAIRLYEKALGAKVQALSRFSEAPGMNPPPAMKDKVLHAQLAVGPDVLMISDCPPDKGTTGGTQISIMIEIEDVDDLRRKFDALGVGGQVMMPVQEMFWGATFGMVRDAYGIGWMLNSTKAK